MLDRGMEQDHGFDTLLDDPMIAKLWRVHPERATETFKASIAKPAAIARRIAEAIVEKPIEPKPDPVVSPPATWNIRYVLIGSEYVAQPTRGCILSAVSQYYDMPLKDIAGPRRHKEFIAARHMAIHLMSELTSSSLPEIGRSVGGRDHTTALSAIRRMKRRIAENDKIDQDAEALKSIIMSHCQGAIAA